MAGSAELRQRMLTKNPGITALALLLLGIGIGINTQFSARWIALLASFSAYSRAEATW